MTFRFGWCIDGHCDACPHYAPGTNQSLICLCHCHEPDGDA